MLEPDFKLKVFITLAQARSFTETARLLGVTQPAVSQNVSELEKQVGEQLVVRSRSEVSLTEKGRIFLVFAKKILDSYEDVNFVFSDFEAFLPLVDKLAK